MAASGPSSVARQRPRIAFVNRFYDRWPSLEGCEGAPAELVLGGQHAGSADALVFHLPSLDRLPPIARPRGQLWVGFTMESRVTCPLPDDERYGSLFDLTVGHERDSDVWCPYFGPGTVPGLLRPPGEKSERAPVAHLQSNPYDACGRNRFVFELMRRVKVDSWGAVLRNRGAGVPMGWPQRVAVMSRYKFTLACENSFGRDYVTDKFFDALVAGSVPVYRGAPEVAELAPAPGCYVDAREFAGAADLAAFLRALDADPAAYARLHAWRAEGLSPAFRAHLERLVEPWPVRLARVVVARLQGGRPPA